MKEICKQYAAYNLWANQKIMNAVLQLTPEQQHFELPGSFGSIYKTTLHMWQTEHSWWQRMKLLEPVLLTSDTVEQSMVEVCNNLLAQTKQWVDWVDGASQLLLEHVFAYQNSKRERFKQPLYEMLMHVFNHGTYHRGQLVNMLRQLGVQKIEPTDFILWTRKK